MENEAPKNLKKFKKIVRDDNKKSGFDFILPNDTDYNSKYAHPECIYGDYTIRGQIDENGSDIYAKTMSIDGINININDRTKKDIDDIFKSDVFKVRLGNLKQLNTLNNELTKKVRDISYNIFADCKNEIEREECYDLIVRTAKQLYKDGGSL